MAWSLAVKDAGLVRVQRELGRNMIFSNDGLAALHRCSNLIIAGPIALAICRHTLASHTVPGEKRMCPVILEL
eukprot:916114-Rhodomonas_salina.1